MNIVLPKPLNATKETVTLSRADWDALLDQLEDIEDLAAVAAADAHEAEVGKDVARRDHLTGEEMRRLLDWESPVKIWREKRGLSQRALAEQAGVSPSYLAEIETNRKPGSADALQLLSRVLDIPMEHLVAVDRLEIAIAHLKAFVEEGASPAKAATEARRVLNEWCAIGLRDDHDRRRVDAAVVELRERLRAVAVEYGRKNQPEWANAMTEIVRRAFA